MRFSRQRCPQCHRPQRDRLCPHCFGVRICRLALEDARDAIRMQRPSGTPDWAVVRIAARLEAA